MSRVFTEDVQGVTAIAGISHTIALDAALLQRYPDANIDQERPSQPRWRWFVRACQLEKRGQIYLFVLDPV